MNDKLNLFVPFEKKNSDEKTVEGFASTEALDCQGEIVNILLLKTHFQII